MVGRPLALQMVSALSLIHILLENSMYNAREASVKLAEATGADCVQVAVMGRVKCTAVEKNFHFYFSRSA